MVMNNLPKRLGSALLVLLLLTIGSPAAGQQISLIRDAEIENTIRAYATPLFTAAGLDPRAVNVHLINDRKLNAFVAGGMNLFLNTGLLVTAENPGQVIGVIAHETGHIAGGHLARTDEALRGASTVAIIAYVLGMAVAAAGSPEAGTAIMLGGETVAVRSYLKYSRSQEAAADQFAVNALDQTGQSSRGLFDFFHVLEGQEALLPELQDPYLRTHPITRERIAFIRRHLEESEFADASQPPEFDAMFRRMKAKLIGFLEAPDTTFNIYREDDQSLEARYARAIAHHRRADIEEALGEIDSLLVEFPDDAYFHELKGQILFESGRVADAIAPYQRAHELLPDTALMRVFLAQAIIENGEPGAFDEAGRHLEAVVSRENDNLRAWRLLSVVYGRTGRQGKSALASAEFAYLTGNFADALMFAKRAIHYLPEGSPGRIRAEDLEFSAKNTLKRRQQ